MATFRKMVEVLTEHEFGVSDPCYFTIYPTPDTEKALKRNRLLFRQLSNSFVLLYDSLSDSEEALVPVTGKEKFRFVLKLNLPEFHSFTDIPMDSSKIFCFSNKTSAKDGSELPLHADSPSEKFVSAKDLFELTYQILRIDEEAVSTTKYTLVDQGGNTIFEKTLNPVESRIFYEHDFSQRSAGLYELRKDDVKVKSFYADNFLAKNKAFAVLEIHTGESIPADYVIVEDDGTVKPKKYQLKFKCRSTTWRYFVIPQYSELEDDDTLEVEGSSGITFSAGVQETLSSGKSAYVFNSDDIFPVKKQPVKNIALKKTNGVSKTLINHLPNPTASSLSFEEEKVYSDIFVYI